MTAPAAVAPATPVAPPVAPVETPSATNAPVIPMPPIETPAAEVKAKTGSIVDQFLSKTLNRAIPPDEPVAAEGTPAVDGAVATLAPDGTITPVETKAETPPATTPAQMVAEITADEPEGQVTLRARDPKTGQFSDMDQSRVYELAIRDKVTGEKKVYEKTLPELMRMARDGVTARQADAELKYYRQNVPQWKSGHDTIMQRATAAEDNAKRLESFAISLLTDAPEIVDRQRAAYQSEFTPEKQVARLQSEIAQLRGQRQTESRQIPAPTSTAPNGVADPAFQQQVMALGNRVSAVIEQAEQVVGADAALGKAMRDLRPLYVNGMIPPENLPKLEQYLAGPYAQWVSEQASAKQTAAQTAAAKAQEVEAARQKVHEDQARAQAAARLVGTATRPSAMNQGAAPSGPSITPRSTVQDRIAAIVHKQPRVAAG